MTPLMLAAVTDRLVDFAVRVVGDLGLPGIFLLMTPESALIPIPSEATMLFAGFNVHNGHYSLLAAVAVGSIANLVGSWIAYAIGYYGRLELLEKSRWIHVKASDLERADRWFARYGAWAVFFSRMLPVVRTFISLPAGVARMPFWRFTTATLLGIVPWVFMLTFIGDQAGARWKSWKNAFHYVDYAVVAIILLAIAYGVYRLWRSRQSRRAVAAQDA